MKLSETQRRALTKLAEIPRGATYATSIYRARLATWRVLRDAGLITTDTGNELHNGTVVTITQAGRDALGR